VSTLPENAEKSPQRISQPAIAKAVLWAASERVSPSRMPPILDPGESSESSVWSCSASRRSGIGSGRSSRSHLTASESASAIRIRRATIGIVPA
jgi:hypothetical protein